MVPYHGYHTQAEELCDSHRTRTASHSVDHRLSFGLFVRREPSCRGADCARLGGSHSTWKSDRFLERRHNLAPGTSPTGHRRGIASDPP